MRHFSIMIGILFFGCSSGMAAQDTVTVTHSDVTGIGAENGVMRRDPSDIIKVGKSYYVWYSKGTIFSGYDATIWYATSTDGHEWTEKGMALAKGEPGSWDAASVFTPNILVAEGKYWLFYTGTSKPYQQPFSPDSKIGIAVSDSADGPWARLATNPALKNSDDPKAFDSHLVDDACLIKREGKYWFYYKGRQLGKSPAQTQMGLAIADNPEGPYARVGENPVIPGNHEVLVWPQGNGVAAMIGTTGPKEITNTIQYADDGIHFSKTHEVKGGPWAGGAWRPEAFTGSGTGDIPEWGVEIGNAKGHLPFIQRFDLSNSDAAEAKQSTQVEDIDWPGFIARHDMTFDKLPNGWTEAPHFGNAMLGSMLYQADDSLRLQIFRADVHDHRDNTSGWTAYSRPRLQIGHFALHPVGKLTGCRWRKDLWNAELTGTITTTAGEIRIRHYVHAEDMAIVTELTPDKGEKNFRWTWHPVEARTTRSSNPRNAAEIERFAEKYGKHYRDTLLPWEPNPAGRLEKRGDTQVWIQDFLVGGGYATAWAERTDGETRTHVASIANSYPDRTAAETAVADARRVLGQDRDTRMKSHRAWWHHYYPRSFVTLPDKRLETLYWQTIYRFGCTSRAGRCMVDTPGIWFQGKSWPYFTTDWNIQSAHWPVYTANRLEQGRALVDRLHQQRHELIKAVRPVEWQEDSAYLPLAVAWDMRCQRDGDMRYYDLVGNLPWAMHNAWWQYRFSMDDELLRENVFPLLRRAINLYLHMIVEDEDGTLRLPPTYSPETGVWKDCNFDLALLKWGCLTLLKASARLGIEDPLIPRWKQVAEKLPDYPADEHGFRLGGDQTSSSNHQHFSNLLMIYPLHLVNIDQEGRMDVMKRSFQRALGTAGPGQRQAMVQAHAGPIGAALGLGDETLVSLRRLQGDLYPNGLWYESPCIESTLAAANIIQDMLLQSWSDPALDEPGLLRIFPALPSAWKDVEFRDLRAEGAFLVSARRHNGRTEWIRIRSLAGEPCRVRPGMDGEIKIEGNVKAQAVQVSPGIYQIDLNKGEEITLRAEAGPKTPGLPPE